MKDTESSPAPEAGSTRIAPDHRFRADTFAAVRYRLAHHPGYLWEPHQVLIHAWKAWPEEIVIVL